MCVGMDGKRTVGKDLQKIVSKRSILVNLFHRPFSGNKIMATSGDPVNRSIAIHFLEKKKYSVVSVWVSVKHKVDLKQV